MRVHELIQALQAMPQEAQVDLCICVGDLDNDDAQAEVANAEALAGLAAEVCDDLVQVEETGRVTVRAWYGEGQS